MSCFIQEQVLNWSSSTKHRAIASGVGQVRDQRPSHCPLCLVWMWALCACNIWARIYRAQSVRALESGRRALWLRVWQDPPQTWRQGVHHKHHPCPELAYSWKISRCRRPKIRTRVCHGRILLQHARLLVALDPDSPAGNRPGLLGCIPYRVSVLVEQVGHQGEVQGPVDMCVFKQSSSNKQRYMYM